MMECTLVGWGEVYACGKTEHPESAHYMRLSLHSRKLWVPQIVACHCQFATPSDALHGSPRQTKESKMALLASSLKHEGVVTLQTSMEEPSFSWAVENAPLLEPAMASLVVEPTPLKPHPSKRRLFPANAVSHSLFGVNASVTSLDAVDYTSLPSDWVVMCFKHLGLTGMPLRKCLKHASCVSEDDLVNLLKTLSSYGCQCSEIKTMFSRYPSLVKVTGAQVDRCFQYYSDLFSTRSVAASLFSTRPALFACDLQMTSHVIDYLVSMGMQKEDLFAIISLRPHILEYDVAVLKSTVSAFLKAKIDKEDIAILIKRAPTAFTPAQGDIEEGLKFWSSVGVEGKALCRAILRRPNLLSYNIASLLSTYRYLQLWFEPRNLTKLVSRFAELLAYDPKTKLEPLINYFMGLGLAEEEVAKIVLRRPQLMSCSIQRLERVADFLRSIGLKDDMVGKILITAPQVFTLNAEDKLARGVDFFRSMGLDKERDIELLFTRNAQVFCCSIEKNLRPTCMFFLNTGFEKEDLAKMIVTFPSVLGQSIEHSLAPKYEYLIGAMKRKNEELVEFPQYFGYSLERRIKPRHKLLTQLGLFRSLPSMLACTDSDFHKRYVEPHSPLPQGLATFNLEENAKKQMALKQQHVSRKKDTILPVVLQKEAIHHDSFPSAFDQEKTLTVDHALKPSRPKPKVDSVHMELEFLNLLPQLHEHQQHLYPAAFREFYKKLSPCGKWIHAYKFDS